MSNSAIIHPLEHPIDVKMNIAGSKSFSNRALIIAALANGQSTLHGVSDANDTVILIRLLNKLGVKIERKEHTLIVKGNGGKLNSFSGELDVEDAGTVMRFLSALCCLIPGEIVLKGSERMHQRPIGGLAEALKQLNAHVSYTGKEGFPPIKIKGGTIKGSIVHVDASQSSQFVSALLMIALVLQNDTEIICDGSLTSLPYIDMTLSVMKHFGIEIKHEGYKHYFIKGGQSYKATEYNIEADASSSTYLLALAALTGSSAEILNLAPNSQQGDSAFADILGEMGCTIHKGSTIKVTGVNELKAIKVDMSGMPDAAQTLAVLAAFAKGETTITGLNTLEHKETDRMNALQTELYRMDIESWIDNSTIRIKGGTPKGAFINTYNDHRMAMAFAIAGTKIPGISIESPDVVRKSFPTFWNTLSSIGVKVELE